MMARTRLDARWFRLAPAPFRDPPARRRGRRPVHELVSPTGVPRPNFEDLWRLVTGSWLYTVTVDDGPVFTRFWPVVEAERNRRSLVQVIAGPTDWIGVWWVVGNPHQLFLDAHWMADFNTWWPIIQVGRGNYLPYGPDTPDAVGPWVWERYGVDPAFWRLATGSEPERWQAARQAQPAFWL